MSEEVSKNFLNITRNFEGNFEKMKSNFEEIFWIKKCIKSKLIRNSPFPSKRASLLRLNRYIRATTRVIREKTIFVDASSGRLPTHLHTEMVVASNCVLSVLAISFTYFNTEIYLEKASFAHVFTDQKDVYKKIFFK